MLKEERKETLINAVVVDLRRQCIVPLSNQPNKNKTKETWNKINPIGIERKQCLLIAYLSINICQLLLLLLSN